MQATMVQLLRILMIGVLCTTLVCGEDGRNVKKIMGEVKDLDQQTKFRVEKNMQTMEEYLKETERQETNVRRLYDRYQTITLTFGSESSQSERANCEKLFETVDNLVSEMKISHEKYNSQSTADATKVTAAARRMLLKTIDEQESKMKQYHDQLQNCKKFVVSIRDTVKNKLGKPKYKQMRMKQQKYAPKASNNNYNNNDNNNDGGEKSISQEKQQPKRYSKMKAEAEQSKSSVKWSGVKSEFGGKQSQQGYMPRQVNQHTAS